MSTIGGGEGAIQRTLRADLAPDVAARASEAARRLAASLEESHAWGPQEAARLVDEVRRLPTEAQEAFLAAAAGASRSTAKEWAERIARACPQGSERRREPGIVIRALESLGSSAAAARIVTADTVERARSFGPFGLPSALVSPGPRFLPTVAPGTLQPGVGLVPAAGMGAPLEGSPAIWRATLARVQAMAPGLVNAIGPMGWAERAVAAVREGLARIGEGEGLWARARRAAGEDALGRVASRFEVLRSRVNVGVETAEALSAGARGGLLGSLARELRGEAAAARRDVALARELVGAVDLDQQGSASTPLSRAEEVMQAAEYGLEAYATQQDLVSAGRPPGEGRISQEELDRLGTGLTPPPPQGFWNIGTVGVGLEPAFSRAEYGQAASTAAGGVLGENPTSVRTIDGAELAAAIRDMGVPLEQVDPNQVSAALSYINTGASGAVAEFGRGAPKAVEEQRERLTLALRQFRSLAEQNPPSMDRHTAIEMM